MSEPDWTLAACAGKETNLWFPTEHDPPAQYARTICSLCTIRDGCLDFALRHGIVHGIWGGTSERERRRIARFKKGPRMERVA